MLTSELLTEIRRRYYLLRSRAKIYVIIIESKNKKKYFHKYMKCTLRKSNNNNRYTVNSVFKFSHTKLTHKIINKKLVAVTVPCPHTIIWARYK